MKTKLHRRGGERAAGPMPGPARVRRRVVKMKVPAQPDAAILNDFPGTCYHANWRLVTWHPHGTITDELADRLVEFAEARERILDKPFHRFTDMTGFTRIELSLDHVFDIAKRRRKGYKGEQVKSAFYAVRLITLSIARMYQELMHGGPIEVGVFPDRAAAAAWLGVPAKLLAQPKIIEP